MKARCDHSFRNSATGMIVELLETFVQDHISMSQWKIVHHSLSSSLNGMLELFKETSTNKNGNENFIPFPLKFLVLTETAITMCL